MNLSVEKRHRLALALLLIFNLAIKLLVVCNTTQFQVSEAGSTYNFLREIENGKKPALYEGNYRTILAYIGHFFKSKTGTLHAFFWFQALLATFSVYLLFLICFRLTNEKHLALYGVILATILMDYHLLTPVFYPQLSDIFFVLLVTYLALLLIDGQGIMSKAALLLVPVLMYVSVFFRSTLQYFYMLLILVALFLLIRRRTAASIRLGIASALTLLLFTLFPHGNFANKTALTLNDFRFFGHTLYGGDGGEGAFIYPRNEERYKQRLKEFMTVRQYKTLTVQIRNEFQEREIREFIVRTPLKWLYLQVRKIAMTFGIVPIRDSLEILSTGKLPMKWYLGGFFIQAPYAMIIVAFIALTVLFFRISDLANARTFFVFLVLFYLIAATCLYGHYQERYRHVVILGGLIPIMSVFFSRLIERQNKTAIGLNRKVLLVLAFFVLIMHWGFQAYNAMSANKERYLKAITRFEYSQKT
jgi:hypothetical protein